ncbi:MAG TPA: SMI1/KNR4 family protein [Mucilaginibacter sp.]|jgi:hypothetical protein
MMNNLITAKKRPLSYREIRAFKESVDFDPPKEFIEFFGQSNGALISSKNGRIVLWPLTDMVKLNREYYVEQLASGLFIFGSDGGDTAYCIEKDTGYIYDMPFIGMLCDLSFVCRSFTEFLEGPLERVCND